MSSHILRVLSVSCVLTRSCESTDAEDLLSPPTQWPEAYSRYLKEWVTLDPTRKLVRCKARMEPVGKAKGTGNTLVYVVGFEEGAFSSRTYLASRSR